MATQVTQYAGETFGDPVNITITAPASGNSLILVFRGSTASLTEVYDNGSGSGTGSGAWGTADQTETGYTGSGNTIYCYHRHNITNSPTQITIDNTGNDLIEWAVFEFSGLANAAATQTNIARGNSSTPTVSVTTTNDNEIGVSMLHLNDGTTVTAGGTATWTEYQPYADPVFETFFSNPDLGTAGSKSCSPTLGTNKDYALTIVTFASSGGGGGGATPKTLLMLGVG